MIQLIAFLYPVITGILSGIVPLRDKKNHRLVCGLIMTIIRFTPIYLWGVHFSSDDGILGIFARLLLIVGGAGSLYVDPEHTAQVKDGAGFPAMFLPLANAQGEELEQLRKRSDVKWTFVSPAGDFQADGERSGKYILAGEELTLNSRGESVISYADYAIAMVDEIEKGDHIQQRISVVRA